MKKIILMVFSALVLFGADLNTYYDLDIASLKAKAENKKVILYVYSTNCPWCKKMDKETYKNTNLVKELNTNYIFVKLNKDIDDIPTNLVPRFVPTTYILDANQHEEFAMYGFKTSSEFLRVLEDMKEEF